MKKLVAILSLLTISSAATAIESSIVDCSKKIDIAKIAEGIAQATDAGLALDQNLSVGILSGQTIVTLQPDLSSSTKQVFAVTVLEGGLLSGRQTKDMIFSVDVYGNETCSLNNINFTK